MFIYIVYIKQNLPVVQRFIYIYNMQYIIYIYDSLYISSAFYS